jgi:hypothetical protein
VHEQQGTNNNELFAVEAYHGHHNNIIMQVNIYRRKLYPIPKAHPEGEVHVATKQ